MFPGNIAAAVYGNSCSLANRPVFILCHASCQQRHLKNNFHAQRKGSAPPSHCSFLSPAFQTQGWAGCWIRRGTEPEMLLQESTSSPGCLHSPPWAPHLPWAAVPNPAGAAGHSHCPGTGFGQAPSCVWACPGLGGAQRTTEIWDPVLPCSGNCSWCQSLCFLLNSSPWSWDWNSDSWCSPESQSQPFHQLTLPWAGATASFPQRIWSCCIFLWRNDVELPVPHSFRQTVTSH